jgi:tetratricopeptide (TPR) repeat protein
LSNAAWKEGRYEQALEYAESAERDMPDYPTIPHLKGQAYYALGRYKEAVPASRKAMQNVPENAVPAFNLGVIYYDEGRDLSSAMECFREALKR